MPPTVVKCVNCRWYISMNVKSEPDEGGECRHGPPTGHTITSEPQNQPNVWRVWPLVRPYDWCGRFTAKGQAKPAGEKSARDES